METVSRADEIANAIVDYVNEAPAHARKDSITEFARGRLHFQVGQSGYTAEAVVAKRNNGELLLYDIVHLTPYKIKEKRSKLPQAIADSANASFGESASKFSIRSKSGNVKKNSSLSLPVEETRDLIALHNEKRRCNARTAPGSDHFWLSCRRHKRCTYE